MRREEGSSQVGLEDSAICGVQGNGEVFFLRGLR